MRTAVERWLSSLERPRRPHEYDGKRLLSAVGLTVPEGIFIAPGSQATLKDRLAGFTGAGHFAAKVCSPDILHKTEENGVVLGLEVEEVDHAVRGLLSRFPGNPVLVERMVRSIGPEIIVGALYDPLFGPAVMAGAGGILTELYSDVAFRLAPCGCAEAERMLGELTIYPALTGLGELVPMSRVLPGYWKRWLTLRYCLLIQAASST